MARMADRAVVPADVECRTVEIDRLDQYTGTWAMWKPAGDQLVAYAKGTALGR